MQIAVAGKGYTNGGGGCAMGCAMGSWPAVASCDQLCAARCSLVGLDLRGPVSGLGSCIVDALLYKGVFGWRAR